MFTLWPSPTRRGRPHYMEAFLCPSGCFWWERLRPGSCEFLTGGEAEEAVSFPCRWCLSFSHHGSSVKAAGGQVVSWFDLLELRGPLSNQVCTGVRGRWWASPDPQPMALHGCRCVDWRKQWSLLTLRNVTVWQQLHYLSIAMGKTQVNNWEPSDLYTTDCAFWY